MDCERYRHSPSRVVVFRFGAFGSRLFLKSPPAKTKPLRSDIINFCCIESRTLVSDLIHCQAKKRSLVIVVIMPDFKKQIRTHKGTRKTLLTRCFFVSYDAGLELREKIIISEWCRNKEGGERLLMPPYNYFLSSEKWQGVKKRSLSIPMPSLFLHPSSSSKEKDHRSSKCHST